MHEAIKELKRKVKDNLVILDEMDKTVSRYYRDIRKQQQELKSCQSLSNRIRKQNRELEQAIKWLEEECNEGTDTESAENT